MCKEEGQGWGSRVGGCPELSEGQRGSKERATSCRKQRQAECLAAHEGGTSNPEPREEGLPAPSWEVVEVSCPGLQLTPGLPLQDCPKMF